MMKVKQRSTKHYTLKTKHRPTQTQPKKPGEFGFSRRVNNSRFSTGTRRAVHEKNKFKISQSGDAASTNGKYVEICEVNCTSAL